MNSQKIALKYFNVTCSIYILIVQTKALKMVCTERLAICAFQNFYLCFTQNQGQQKIWKMIIIILDDELLETYHKDYNYSKENQLMSSKEILKCREIKSVLQYYQPNPNKSFETCAYHLLFSFYPFRNKEGLKSPPLTRSYQVKLLEPDVINIINRNKATMEPFSELVDQGLLSVQSDIHSHDAFL